MAYRVCRKPHLLENMGILRIASSCCIDEGEELFAVNRSFAAAGDVVYSGDRAGWYVVVML